MSKRDLYIAHITRVAASQFSNLREGDEDYLHLHERLEFEVITKGQKLTDGEINAAINFWLYDQIEGLDV